MAFFSRWFRSGSPMDEIRKASRQGRWADLLGYASALEDCALSESDRMQLKEMVDSAADQLARMNLEEGIASLRADDFRRGMEHLDLARQLVRSEELRRQIDAELSGAGASRPVIREEEPERKTVKASCASSCCSPPSVESVAVDPSEFDEATRFDLVLTAYPFDLRPRYLELSPALRRAILLAHEEGADEALSAFAGIADSERNDIFFYEFGSLLGRCKRYREAVAALQTALSLNPGYLLAVLMLVELYQAHGDHDAAERLLTQMLQVGCMPDYCQAHLAAIWQGRGDTAKAFEHATEALRLGHNSRELMVFVAGVMEDAGRLDEAENVLSAIPTGGGCSGGANVDLAEFWLRQNKKLNQALEMFKKAGKGDPGNPVWGFHIARVYLALGWVKEANQILETFSSSDLIDPTLRENALKLLRTSG